jgi:hypothetical protein
MFTGKEPIESANSGVAYHEGVQPREQLELLRDAIRLLDACVAAARGHRGDPTEKKKNASLDLLVGFGLAAMSESRAVIALVSIGLERSSRIHMRSLHEYCFRATLVLKDPETAHRFKIAAAREMRKYAAWFQLDESRVREAEKRYLEDAEPGQEPQREQVALGGDMASLMKKETGDDKKYATTFGLPSLFSHGSILALYELSEATANRQGAFAEGVFRDGMGADTLLQGTAAVLQMTLLMIQHFGIGALDDWDSLKARLDKIAGSAGLTRNP